MVLRAYSSPGQGPTVGANAGKAQRQQPISRRLILWAACAGVGATIVAAVLPVFVPPHPESEGSTVRDIWHVVLMSAWVAAGLAATWQRPENRIGPLMAAVGFLIFLTDIAWWHAALPYTALNFLGVLHVAVLAHVLVSFPSGRLSTRVERIVVALAYVDALVFANLSNPFLEPCRGCPHNLVLIHPSRSLTDAAGAFALRVETVLAVAIIVVLAKRWRRSTPAARRMLAPVLCSGVILAAVAAAYSVHNSAATSPLGIADVLAYTAFPLVFLFGLLSARLHRGAIARLVIELGSAPSPSAVREPLARALGDPSLEVAFWIPTENRYVNADGQPAELPTGDPARAITVLGDDRQPVAALSYDASLFEDRTFLNAVAAATRLTLENARLHAEVRAQLLEVRASRARIVAAGDDERKRLERNLHDGAQQRLLASRLALQLARGAIEQRDGARALLDEADAEVQGALEDIRALARGLHPAILSDQGLAAALATLARRSQIPVEIVCLPVDRLPAAVETAAYYLAAEALANVGKHADASRVRIEVHREGDRAVVLVDDDGRGGATAPPGGGLAGLRDRIEAIGGRLMVNSKAGAGTRLRADIPCA